MYWCMLGNSEPRSQPGQHQNTLSGKKGSLEGWKGGREGRREEEVGDGGRRKQNSKTEKSLFPALVLSV